jgi:hypothetical protein
METTVRAMEEDASSVYTGPRVKAWCLLIHAKLSLYRRACMRTPVYDRPLREPVGVSPKPQTLNRAGASERTLDVGGREGGGGSVGPGGRAVQVDPI